MAKIKGMQDASLKIQIEILERLTMKKVKHKTKTKKDNGN